MRCRARVGTVVPTGSARQKKRLPPPGGNIRQWSRRSIILSIAALTASAPMVLKVLRRRSRCRCWPPTCTALDCCCGDGLNDDAPPDRLAGFRPSPPARDGSGFPCLTAEIGAVCHQFDLSHSPVSAVVAELVAKNTQERWRFVAGRSRIPSLREVFWLTLATYSGECDHENTHHELITAIN